MKGYRELLQRIEPEFVLCYHTPFPEMEGNIIPISYERSSWRYLSYHPEANESDFDMEAYKIGGAEQLSCDIMEPYMVSTGSGSAYGGPWKPKKPEDERFIGEPGEIKVTYDRNGKRIETKIGEDGRAVKERHFTSAPNPKYQSNPHDHIINWESPYMGIPNMGPSINYWGEVPEFKDYSGKGVGDFLYNSFEENRFKTISEFKNCVIRGGEPVFEWNGIQYGVCIMSGEIIVAKIDGSLEQRYQTADAALTYMVGADCLRDVVTQVKVWHRNI